MTREIQGYAVFAKITKWPKEKAVCITDTKLLRRMRVGTQPTPKPIYGFICVDFLFGWMVPTNPRYDKIKGKDFTSNLKVSMEEKMKRLQ